jgi:hypothetical protein
VNDKFGEKEINKFGNILIAIREAVSPDTKMYFVPDISTGKMIGILNDDESRELDRKGK